MYGVRSSTSTSSYPFGYRFYKCSREVEEKNIPNIPHYIHTIHIIHSTRGTEIILTFCCGAWCDVMRDARCDRRDTGDDGGLVVRCDENVNRENRDWKIWQRWSEKSPIVPYRSLSDFQYYTREFKCCCLGMCDRIGGKGREREGGGEGRGVGMEVEERQTKRNK